MIAIFHSVLEWASRPAVLTALFASSGVSLIASVIALPWYLKRLPADYFVRGATLPIRTAPRLGQSVFVAMKNVIGGLLMLAGVAMLVLPGQGVATIVVGLLMMQFPGKRRIERKVLSIPPVLRAVNAMRIRNGQAELQMPARAPLGALAEAPHSVR